MNYKENIFADAMRESMKKIVNNTIKGQCSRCGECCNDILPVTPDELLRIVNYINTTGIKPIRKAVLDKDGKVEAIHMLCPFLNKEQEICLIYPVRPRICQRFQCNQSPNQMVENQYDCVINKKDVIYVSMHVTFLNDEAYMAAIIKDSEWSNMLSFVTFEEGDTE